MTLESRYRRLLMWLPPAYRAEYGEEMLDVLLAAAGPRQRRPRPAEAIDLIMTGAKLRLGQWGSGLGDRRWADASAVFGLLGATVVALGAVWPILMGAAWQSRMMPVNSRTLVSSTEGVWIGGWLVIVLAALLGWRLIAAGGAWLAVGWAAIWAGVHYRQESVGVIYQWRTLVLLIAVALALSVKARPHLDRRGRTLLGVGITVMMFLPLLDPMYPHIHWTALNEYYRNVFASQGSTFPWAYGIVGQPFIKIGAFGVTALLVVMITGVRFTIRLPAAIRRRFLAYAAVPGTLTLIIATAFQSLLAPRGYDDPPVQATWIQWLALTAAPLLAALIGITVVNILDRREHLTELSRASQHRNAAPATHA